MVKWIAAIAVLSGCLVGCLNLKPDEVELTSPSTSRVSLSIPDCAGCHSYPLNDVNHNFHLRSASTRESMESIFPYERKTGVMVCMDCHFGSMAHRGYTWYDTLWGTADDLRVTADKLPGDPIYRIDSIPGFLPMPAGVPEAEITAGKVDHLMDSAASIGAVVAWLTSLDHMNGVVDVEFSPNIVLDTSLSKMAFQPRDLSCSAIECHNAPKKVYRWASHELRLPGCPTPIHTPELDSSCRYSPNQEP